MLKTLTPSFHELNEQPLSELDFASANWAFTPVGSSGRTVLDADIANQLKISLLLHKSGTKNPCKELHITIGSNVMKKCGWEVGDKLYHFYDQDNLRVQGLVKNVKGYKLTYYQKPAHGHFYTCKVCVPFRHMPFDLFSSTVTPHFVDKNNRLLFKLVGG